MVSSNLTFGAMACNRRVVDALRKETEPRRIVKVGRSGSKNVYIGGASKWQSQDKLLIYHMDRPAQHYRISAYVSVAGTVESLRLGHYDEDLDVQKVSDVLGVNQDSVLPTLLGSFRCQGSWVLAARFAYLQHCGEKFNEEERFLLSLSAFTAVAKCFEVQFNIHNTDRAALVTAVLSILDWSLLSALGSNARRRSEFVRTTVDAFFDNDLLWASRKLLASISGCVCLNLAHSLDPQSVALATRGQPLSLCVFYSGTVIWSSDSSTFIKLAATDSKNKARRASNDKWKPVEVGCTNIFGKLEDGAFFEDSKHEEEWGHEQRPVRLDLDEIAGETVLVQCDDQGYPVPRHGIEIWSSRSSNVRLQLARASLNLLRRPLRKRLVFPRSSESHSLNSINEHWTMNCGSTFWCFKRRLRQQLRAKEAKLKVFIVGAPGTDLKLAQQFALDLGLVLPRNSIVRAVSDSKLLEALLSGGTADFWNLELLRGSLALILSSCESMSAASVALAHLLPSKSSSIFALCQKNSRLARALFAQQQFSVLDATCVFDTTVSTLGEHPAVAHAVMTMILLQTAHAFANGEISTRELSPVTVDTVAQLACCLQEEISLGDTSQFQKTAKEIVSGMLAVPRARIFTALYVVVFVFGLGVCGVFSLALYLSNKDSMYLLLWLARCLDAMLLIMLINVSTLPLLAHSPQILMISDTAPWVADSVLWSAGSMMRDCFSCVASFSHEDVLAQIQGIHSPFLIRGQSLNSPHEPQLRANLVIGQGLGSDILLPICRPSFVHELNKAMTLKRTPARIKSKSSHEMAESECSDETEFEELWRAYELLGGRQDRRSFFQVYKRVVVKGEEATLDRFKELILLDELPVLENYKEENSSKVDSGLPRPSEEIIFGDSMFEALGKDEIYIPAIIESQKVCVLLYESRVAALQRHCAMKELIVTINNMLRRSWLAQLCRLFSWRRILNEKSQIMVLSPKVNRLLWQHAHFFLLQQQFRLIFRDIVTAHQAWLQHTLSGNPPSTMPIHAQRFVDTVLTRPRSVRQSPQTARSDPRTPLRSFFRSLRRESGDSSRNRKRPISFSSENSDFVNDADPPTSTWSVASSSVFLLSSASFDKRMYDIRDEDGEDVEVELLYDT